VDLQTNTQHFTKIVEDIIREYPEQYFWLHQRWKTKPWQVKKLIIKRISSILSASAKRFFRHFVPFVLTCKPF